MQMSTKILIIKQNWFPCFLFTVNKQLNDKERVAAALENPNLLDMVDECLAPSYGWASNILEQCIWMD